MPDPIHVAITRRVKPGCEEEFAERLRAFVERSLAAPGALAVYCLSPAPGGTDYGILRSFASAEAKHAFYASALYQEWLEEVAPLVEGAPQIRDLHGLEAFLAKP
jgi:hypothetical protein